MGQVVGVEEWFGLNGLVVTGETCPSGPVINLIE